MKQILVALLAVIMITGCKKSAQPGTDITTKTITGRWTVSSIVYQSYRDGKVERESTLEAYAYDFEFKPDGTLNYYEKHIVSTGQYSITYQSGKYYYTVATQGRYGALDEGKAEIKMNNKNSFNLRFETSDISGLRYVVLETMVRK